MKPKNQKPRRPQAVIEHSLEAWSVAANRDTTTLIKALIKVEWKHEAGKLIPFHVIRDALYGEEHELEMQERRLDIAKKERLEKAASGTLVEWEVILKLLNEMLINPLIQALDAAPDGVSREWVEKVVKPAMREKLKNPKA